MSDHDRRPFDEYLSQVQRHIVRLPAADQARIIAELRAHLYDAAADAGRTPEDLATQQAVIAALGPSRRLGRAMARAYRPALTPRRLALLFLHLARALVATAPRLPHCFSVSWRSISCRRRAPILPSRSVAAWFTLARRMPTTGI